MDQPFWPDAIGRDPAQAPEFVFIAEVYWDMEWELQQAGFNFTYDKRLYDRLVARQARPVREHLRAAPGLPGSLGCASWRTTTSRARPPTSSPRRCTWRRR